MKNNFLSVLAVATLAAAVGGGVGYLASQNDSTIEQWTSAIRGGDTLLEDTVQTNSDTRFASFSAQSALDFPDLTRAAEMGVEAVVSVVKTEDIAIAQSWNPFFDFFGTPQQQYGAEPQTRQQTSSGSGVIIGSDGYIVTNNHVVENASSLKVRLYDGRNFDATIVGTDPTTDIALIKIDATGLPTLPFGSSDKLRLGEWVLAIGSPYDLQSTVTAGIVSAKARTLRVIPNAFSIESFIQTDAAINPGNSGGALVNSRGELVGINTVIKSPTGSYAGYSFAVPETIVQKVVSDLKEYGIVQRALLGISYRVVDQAFVDQFGKDNGVDAVGGVYVAEVDPNGAANSAGIEKGDVIIEIDGVKVDSQANLSELVGKHRPGDKITVTVKRDKKVKHFEVVLRNKTGKVELTSRADAETALGGSFETLEGKALKSYGVSAGVLVTEVNPDGVLGRAGIRKGYLITHINEKPIRSIRDIQSLEGDIRLIEGVYPGGRNMGYVIVGK